MASDSTTSGSSETIIGIDFGTSKSVVAVVRGGEAVVLSNQEGNRTTPSVVAVTAEGETLVGEGAQRRAMANPRDVLYSIKRCMGQGHGEGRNTAPLVPYEIIRSDGVAKIRAGGKKWRPEELSGLILRKLKEAAEHHLGHEVRKAVISVPSCFDEAHRLAIADAARLAGFKVARLIPSPSAAALGYWAAEQRDEKIAVLDLGGGTASVSIFDVGEGVLETISTAGDPHLGGIDWDDALINHIAEQFREEHGIELRKDPMALQRLRDAAENAKKELSFSAEAAVNLPFAALDAGGTPKHLAAIISRSRFEELTAHLVERCRGLVAKALEDANLQRTDLAEVVIVGGASRMPCVQELVEEVFGKEPYMSLDPDEGVAVGTAIQAGVIAGERKDIFVLDITPYSLGVETEGGRMVALIPRGTTIPTEKKESFTTSADNQSYINVFVYQGEEVSAAANRLLGAFRVEGIPPAPKGTPDIRLALNIGADFILSLEVEVRLEPGHTPNASAAVNAYCSKQRIGLESPCRLSREEIRLMRREAIWPIPKTRPERGRRQGGAAAASSAPTSGRCIACGHHIGIDDAICPNCSAPQDDSGPTQEAGKTGVSEGFADTFECPGCGRELPHGQTVCPYCDEDEAEPEAASTAEPTAGATSPPKTEKRCVACGYHIGIGVHRCPKCDALQDGSAPGDEGGGPSTASNQQSASPSAREDTGTERTWSYRGRFEYLWNQDWSATCPTCRTTWSPRDFECEVCHERALWAFDNSREYFENRNSNLELRCLNCGAPAMSVVCPSHNVQIFGKHLTARWSKPLFVFEIPLFFMQLGAFLLVGPPTLFIVPFKYWTSHINPWIVTFYCRHFPHGRKVAYNFITPSSRDRYARPVGVTNRYLDEKMAD